MQRACLNSSANELYNELSTAREPKVRLNKPPTTCYKLQTIRVSRVIASYLKNYKKYLCFIDKRFQNEKGETLIAELINNQNLLSHSELIIPQKTDFAYSS